MPPGQFHRFHRLTVDDGLSQNLALFIHQDRQGFMWFGTAGGLDRYDGIEFKAYRDIKGLSKQPVYFYSCVENASTFWIGTELGLMRFNPITKSGQMFSLPRSMVFAGRANTIPSLMLLKDETLLLSVTGKGLVRFDTRSQKFSMLYEFEAARAGHMQENIAGMAHWKNGNALAITFNHLFSYDAQQQVLTRLIDFSAHQQPNCIWNDAKTQSVLIGTRNGVLSFRNNNLTTQHFSAQNDLENISITSIFRDSKGTLWLGTEDGLMAVNDARNSIVHYRNNFADGSSIMAGAVMRLMEDRTENLWMSLLDQGLCRIDLKKKKFYSITNRPGFPQQLASTIISGISVDGNDNLWVGGEGLAYVDLLNDRITLHRAKPGDPATAYARNTRRIHSLNDSLLCVIANERLFLFDRKTSTGSEPYIDGAPLPTIYRAHVRRRSGNILCINADSIFEIDPKQKRRVATLMRLADQTLFPKTVYFSSVIEDDSGNIWFGINDGLLRYDEAHAQFQLMTDSPSNPTSLAFSGDHIIWVGTIAGLYRFDIRSHSVRGFHVRDGMPNDKIWSVGVDRRNRVWATTNRGLARITELPDGTATIRSYTTEDGLPSNEFSMGVAATDSKGRMYFGTANGVVFFSPDSVSDNSYPPQVALTDLKIYGTPVSLERDIPFAGVLNIPFDAKVFSITFAALDFTNPAQNKYQYKMEGYDDDWVNAGHRHEAFYTNLNPGHYTFLVRASNNDQVWTETPYAISMEIIPPFWMTWWFRTIVGLLVVGTIVGGIRYMELRRIRRRLSQLEQERAVERERTRISRDMHDELGANLTSLSMMTEIARRSLDENPVVDKQLRRMTSLASETIQKLDEIVWAINPKADTLENLVAYISEYVQEFFDATSVRVRFDFPESIPALALASEQRHSIFLVVKEALTNIVKHASASEVVIVLRNEERVLRIEVRDNGRGFDGTADVGPGNGVRNMRQRIESIGGTLVFDSVPGRGTKVRIEVPNKA